MVGQLGFLVGGGAKVDIGISDVYADICRSAMSEPGCSGRPG